MSNVLRAAAADARLSMQRGIGAIEYIAIAFFMVISLGIGMHWFGVYSDNTVDSAVADQFKQAMIGAKTYTDNNGGALQGSPTTVVNWAQLASSMPAGLASTNSFGQTYQLAVQATGVAPNVVLNAILETVGGKAIPENRMRHIAQLVGGAGGYVTIGAPTQATGSYGGWTATLASYGANPGVGSLAGALFYQSAAQLNTAYLYRAAVPNHPELNTMSTAINLAGNNINSGGAINAATFVAAAGNGYKVGNSFYYGDGTNSAIRQNGGLFIQNLAGSGPADISSVFNVNAAGTVVSTGLQVNGNANVAASLGVAGNAQVNGYTTLGGLSVNGGATMNSTLSVGGGTYLYGGTVVYNGLTVGSGNINVAGGSIMMSDGGQINNSGTQYIEAAGNLYLKPFNGNGQTIVGGGGGSGQLVVTGTTFTQGAVFASQPVYLAATANAGQGCGANGVTTDGSGTLLNCKGGVWTAVGGNPQPRAVGQVSNDTVIGPYNWCYLQGFTNPQSDGTGLWEIGLQSDGGPNNRYFLLHNSKGGGGIIMYACF